MDSFKKLKKHHKIFFALIGAFALVLFWRGTWMIADVLIFPDNYFLSGTTSLIMGIIILGSAGLFVRYLS